jgi:Transposase
MHIMDDISDDMDDISDDTKVARRQAEITSVVRRRRWSDEEKGQIVAEAIAPGAVIADVGATASIFLAAAKASREQASYCAHPSSVSGACGPLCGRLGVTFVHRP